MASFKANTRLDARDLLSGFFNRAEQRFPDIMTKPPASLADWAAGVPIILDGRPFDFNQHAYLVGPYNDTHPFQVEEKAVQMGCTVRALLRALHSARYRKFKGILYLFPSRSDVSDFVRGRVDPMLRENSSTLGQWTDGADSTAVKRFWNCSIFFRGMRSRTGLKSVPVDLVVFDELDEAPQSAVLMASERLSHSVHKEILQLSNPTLPSYGIDYEFQQTDMKYWLLRCPKCGEHNCLEDLFPDCLIEFRGRTIRACRKCHSELNPQLGSWVAKRPSITDKRGYHYSQLFSEFVQPSEILYQYRTATNRADFWNLKIGIPWVEAQNRLTIEEILSLCSDDGIADSDAGPCSMGVDQGKDLHVVIGKRDYDGSRIIHLGVYKDWSELDRLLKIFNVSRAVVDGLPEMRNARAFAERHRGKIFLNFYSDHQKGAYAWNEGALTVSSNRTESLDASHNDILGQHIHLPKECDVVREFAQHCHNVAKKLEEDEETGSKRYVYVKLGVDHFRHAYNYLMMAMHYGAGSLFANSDLS